MNRIRRSKVELSLTIGRLFFSRMIDWLKFFIVLLGFTGDK